MLSHPIRNSEEEDDNDDVEGAGEAFDEDDSSSPELINVDLMEVKVHQNSSFND
jgi:hypothetical protein